MKISVILAHPGRGSINHAIAQAAVDQLESNGHTVFFHDLYREHSDPLLALGEIPKDACMPRAGRIKEAHDDSYRTVGNTPPAR